MGDGQAIAEFLIGHHIVREVASLTAVRTTEKEGHLTMLMYLYDETAVSTQLILTSRVLPADGPFAGDLDIQVPLLQSIVGSPRRLRRRNPARARPGKPHLLRTCSPAR